MVLFTSDLTAGGTTFRSTRRSCHSPSRPCAIRQDRAIGARDYVVADAPDGAAPEPGAYDVAGRRITVNVDPKESAVAAMSAADFEKLLQPADAAAAEPVELRAQQVEGRKVSGATGCCS